MNSLFIPPSMNWGWLGGNVINLRSNWILNWEGESPDEPLERVSGSAGAYQIFLIDPGVLANLLMSRLNEKPGSAGASPSRLSE